MFAFAVMEAASKALQRSHRIAVTFEHSEDLGLASVFQQERLRGIVEIQARSTFAFHQCDFSALSPKPRRLVTNVGALSSSFTGWPVFDKNDNYLKPLPKSCGHVHEPLVDAAGKSRDRLTESAAHPAEVNKWLAEHVVMWLSRSPAGWVESSLGVSCPQKASVPPTRKKLMPGMSWTSEVLYIGRGAKAHGPAAFVWSNPWKVLAVGRDAAMANYKEYLAKSGDLQGRLRGLSGKTLVCHCGDLDRCHRDRIIEAFELAVAKQDKVENESSVEDLDSGNEGPSHKLGDGPVGKGHLSEFVVKASGVTSSMAAVCALLKSGRLAKGGSLTRRQCGAYGAHW